MHTEVVPAALDQERLDRVVAMATGLSRSKAAELVAGGDVEVNGEPVLVRSHRLAVGDVVDIDLADRVDSAPLEPDPSVPVEVVHADEDVIVVDKSAGVVVHPGAGHATGTLVHGLLARFPELAGVGEPDRPGIVHRLDRDTSGLLMVARTPAAHADLVAQLAARTVDRRYQALAWGHLEHRAGRIDGPIGRSRRHRTRMAVTAEGRPAITDYRVLAEPSEPVDVTRLELRLHTGRTHQIRVHLRSIGHPVVGDELYGGVRQSFDVPRLFLHAELLGFDHPRTGAHLELRSPLPADLAEVLARLGP